MVNDMVASAAKVTMNEKFQTLLIPMIRMPGKEWKEMRYTYFQPKLGAEYCVAYSIRKGGGD